MQLLDEFDEGRIADLLRRKEYFWLDLDGPSDADVAALGKKLGLHPLAIEDAQNRGQRPKIENYDDYVFVVYYGAAGGDGARIDLEEVHSFVSGDYLVTLHAGECSALDETRRRMEATPPKSEQFVIYRVLDSLTDTFFPLLERLEERLEDLDEEIFEDVKPEQYQELAGLRRDLVRLSRVVGPQRDLLPRSESTIREIPGLEADAGNYFRDLEDHAIRISSQVDSLRELLNGSRDAYLSVSSNRLNEVTKQLTVVATIFLPLSFIVGFFGQNFDWMTRHIGSAGAFWGIGVGSMVVSLAALAVWLRRSAYP